MPLSYHLLWRRVDGWNANLVVFNILTLVNSFDTMSNFGVSVRIPIEFFTQLADWVKNVWGIIPGLQPGTQGLSPAPERPRERGGQAYQVDLHLKGRTIFANDLMDLGQNLVFIFIYHVSTILITYALISAVPHLLWNNTVVTLSSCLNFHHP